MCFGEEKRMSLLHVAALFLHLSQSHKANYIPRQLLCISTVQNAIPLKEVSLSEM